MSRKLRDRKPISYYEPEEPAFDEYVYCEKCHDFVYEYCSVHGSLLIIPDDKVPNETSLPSFIPRAALTTPREFLHIAPSIIPGAGLGVFSTLTLPCGVRFGPYRGRRTDEINSLYCWQLQDTTKKNDLNVIDGQDANVSNWMRYVNCSRHWCEQNLVAYQYRGELYYRTIKLIPKFTELLVFYGSEFADELGIDLRKYNSIKQYHNAIGQSVIIEDENFYKREVHDAITSNKNTNINKALTVVEYIEEIDGNDSAINVCDGNDEHATNNSEINDLITIDDSSDNIDANFNEIAYNYLLDGNESEINITFKNINHNTYDSSNMSNETVLEHAPTRLEKKHICNVCNKSYDSSSKLKRHSICHLEQTKYICEKCNYKTNILSSYKRHNNTHAHNNIKGHGNDEKSGLDYSRFGEGNSIVDLSKNVTNYNGMEYEKSPEHAKIEDGNYTHESSLKNVTDFNVTEYKKIFPERSNIENSNYSIYLRKDVNNAGNEYGDREILIENGNDNFAFKNKNSNNKIYNCEFCEFRTDRFYIYRIHINGHTRNVLFKCNLCLYVGTKKKYINRHMKRHKNI